MKWTRLTALTLVRDSIRVPCNVRGAYQDVDADLTSEVKSGPGSKLH